MGMSEDVVELKQKREYFAPTGMLFEHVSTGSCSHREVQIRPWMLGRDLCT